MHQLVATALTTAAGLTTEAFRETRQEFPRVRVRPPEAVCSRSDEIYTLSVLAGVYGVSFGPTTRLELIASMFTSIVSTAPRQYTVILTLPT